MFCAVIGIYSASSVMTGLFSAVRSLATVRRSSFTLEGFSTVPPDFTDVRIVVSSALSSEIFFFRSSGSICFISRLRSIANWLLLLRFYLNGFRNGRLNRRCRRNTGRRSLHRGLVYEIHSGRQDSDFDALASSTYDHSRLCRIDYDSSSDRALCEFDSAVTRSFQISLE